mmetsp:Transcript_3643/g.5265  ORF Transcript_3643/g.5265 Transcript_3643/m.5265 type:complete len:601 (+) Transcript_3643:211-2013(+)
MRRHRPMKKFTVVFSFLTWSISSQYSSAFCPSCPSQNSLVHYNYNNHGFGGEASTQKWSRISPKLFTVTNDSSDDDHTNNHHDATASSSRVGVRNRMRKSVTSAKERVKRLVSGSNNDLQSTLSGQPIAEVLADAAISAAEMAAEEIRSTAFSVIQRTTRQDDEKINTAFELETQAQIEADALIAMDSISLAKTSVADAFDAAEIALTKVEADIAQAREKLEAAKRDAALGLAVAEKAAADAVMNARSGMESKLEVVALETAATTNVAAATAVGGGQVEEELLEVTDKTETDTELDGKAVVVNDAESSSSSSMDDSVDTSEISIPDDEQSDFDVSTLKYEDVDYTLTDMAPPFINEDECLIPGEPVVRVEKAPQNSRRIFAGIDIPVSVEDVWELLTDYPNLQKVVPNLVVNEVLELYPGGEGEMISVDTSLSDAEQCKAIANHMKGAVLKQVGGAKVVGINFSARTTLEVREWPSGMPDFAHYEDEIYEGKSRGERVRESKGRELTRYVFPRPFALSSLPHKDISMQSIEKDDGEFRMYQGVWRMQPLPGCSPPGESAMRLTYAVEVSPRPYLPVALVEGRIAQDLCANLKAIRERMTS